MTDWKQAFAIAKLELKASVLSFVFVLGFILLLLSSLVSSLDSYMNNGYAGFDLLFILIFTFAPVWLKPKDFQSQIIYGDLLASPALVMQNQLPIRKEVLIKSRFIIHFFYSFPFQLLTVIALYTFSPLQDLLSFDGFIAFAVMWIAFGVYAGYSIPYSEAGSKAPVKENTFMVVLGFIFLIAVLFLFSFIHLLFGNGIVYWSIIFAQKWPLLTSIISIMLAIAGYQHWRFYMKKRMRNIDYL
ncbi:hypothetical protein ACDX78_18415 [Virgibacillus oceani]